MLALILLILQMLLLAYFLFFAFYLFRYGYASIFKKPVIKKVQPSDSKVAVVIVSYNEGNIVKDTIKYCDKLTYKNKVIICADDSNDGITDTLVLQIAKDRGAQQLLETNYIDHGRTEVYESDNFVYFHRLHNEGFKAGSLKELEKYLKAKGFVYMYLLDADWDPQPDVIERCLEVIEADKKIAFVQTKRLSYHGPEENLQRCLALNEDGNYFVDLPGRQNIGDMILFSGCCTLFRLKYLYQTEGFRPGHITEDIDLTNRFYLQGHKGVYLHDIENLGEVPIHYTAYRRQQDRWARGTARTFKEYFWPIIFSKKMNWKEKFSLIRQNGYYTTAVAIEFSILLALLNVILLSFFKDKYTTILLEYYDQHIAKPYTILLLVALFSNFIPLIITCFKRKNYVNFLFIPYATWLAWSNLHNYFISNMKGFFNIKPIWVPTPKLSARQRTLKHKSKIKMPRSFFFKFLNFATLILMFIIYWLEWSYLGRIDIYAFFWIPSMTVGTIFS